MNDLRGILKEITKLTNEIESDYPELYKFLDEDPMTLPIAQHPKVDKNTLKQYLESLQQLLKHHMETHAKENQNENG